MVRDPSIVSPSLTGMFIGGGHNNGSELCTAIQPLTFAGELANWFMNWFGELAVRSVSEFALDGIPLVRCIGSVVRPWVPEPSN